MIPNVVHFVFGLTEQHEPFHFLHYVAIESCRRVLEPDRIYFHHRHEPWGPYWDTIRSELALVETDLVAEVLEADYSAGLVPGAYRYAHHADFIRLDALIEYGGIYADIDTIFLRPVARELFGAPFVIGREPNVFDERSGELRPSLCNAFLMAEPNTRFARVWRDQMASELNGTWSNHSGFLAQRLSEAMPAEVRIEPEVTFFPIRSDRQGIATLLEREHALPATASSVHLWAHLWWDPDRRDMTQVHHGWCTPPMLRQARTTLGELAKPYLPEISSSSVHRVEGSAPRLANTEPDPEGTSEPWDYLSFDERSGYGVAAERYRAALEGAGVDVRWTPFIRGAAWDLGYEPPPWLEPFPWQGVVNGCRKPIVIGHLVAEYLPIIRERSPGAYLVANTVWDTDRLPEHWIPALSAADLIVVPSHFSEEAIAAARIPRPVAMVPHVAPDVRRPAARTWNDIPPDVVVFYTIAEWNERKAVFKTIEAYLRAFSGQDRVLLIVKTSHRDLRLPIPGPRRVVAEGTTPWAVARLLREHRDAPKIQLVTRALSPAEIAALHTRGDCFVSLCRSEGFGLGAFDAAAYGNPVVTTAFGGHLDYLAGSPSLVRFELVPANDPPPGSSYTTEQRWAEPDVDHGAALMSQIAHGPKNAAMDVAPLAREIRWRYRPTAVAEAMRIAVDGHRHTGSESAKP